MKKTYSILIALEIKAQSLEKALKQLENLKHRKKFRVIGMKYNGAYK